MLKKIAVGIVAAVALYALLGFFAAPPLIKRAIERDGAEALGRAVSVGDVRVNPFLLTATLQDLGVAGVLDVKELHADASSASLLGRGIVLSELRIASPRLRVARTAPNRYDVSDIIDRLLAGPKKEPARVRLQQLELSDGSIDFDDRPEQTKHAVRELRLSIPFVSSLADDADRFVEPLFSAVVNGARVNLSGRVKPFSDSRETSLEVELAGVELPRYAEYLPFPVGVKLESGVIGGKARIGFREGKTFGVAGTLVLQKLELRGGAGEPLVSVPRAEIAVASLDLLGRSLVLDRVRLEGPRVHLVRGSDGRLRLPQTEAAEAGSKPFAFELVSGQVVQGELTYADQAVSPALNKALDNVTIEASGISSKPGAKGEVSLSFDTRAGEKASAKASVSLGPFAAEGSFELAGVPVPAYAAYYSLPVTVESANARTAGGFRWADGALRLTGVALGVSELRVRQGERELARLAGVDLEGMDIDVPARTVSIASATVRDGTVAVRRDAAGALNLAQLAPAGKAEGPGWSVALARAGVSGLVVGWEDAAAPTPVKLSVGPIAAKAENLGTRAGTTAKLNATLSLGGRGSLALSGPLQTAPLSAKLEVEAKGLPVGAFHPYFSHVARIAVAGGELSGRGTVTAADGVFGYQGALELANVAIASKGATDPLLEWGSLAFNGVQARSEPLSLRVAEAVLASFYARLVVLPEGRLSLHDVLPAGGPQPAAASSKPPDIAIDRFVLKDGTVDFTDLFVKPNFSAHLTGVAGQVQGLSADPSTRAKVDLTARIEQTAPVSISGTVNPLAEEIALDLVASVKGYDLNLLSTYAAKYIGYGIEKGKLSLDLRYRLENRKLEAENRIFLDQLTFGRPVESPDALRLPVLLAVKLLQNSRGEIDVSVPISGSLDDPQFSMGEIVMKVIGNMIVNTITAPFRFLGSLFSGADGNAGAELSWIGFEPGREDITPEAEKKMDTLARALADRPQLSLEIAGRTSPADAEALKRRRLEARLAPKGERIAPADYPRLLRQLYEREQPPVPAAKEPGLEEMEKQLLARIPVTPDDLRALAARRGVAVQGRLAGKGVGGERMFLVSPSGEGSEGTKNAPEARADLYLK